jgi:hypothetical protein
VAYSKGGPAVSRYIAQMPTELEAKVLRGAARAGGNVIAEDARERSRSQDVSDAITTKVKSSPGQIRSTVSVKTGWARSVGIWLEYGTAPHFISVDDSQREGRSTKRINELNKDGASLVIGGKFVGTTVFHKGAQAYPFMRPALDHSAVAAIAAAQSYINARVSRRGITGTTEAGDEE